RRLPHAPGPGAGQRRLRRRLRPVPDRLADRGGRLPLQPRRGDRPVLPHDTTVPLGESDIMTASIAGLSGDRRLQAVLVAFSFGAFIEGAAGFGAPVAISAAVLGGLGRAPVPAGTRLL